MKQVVLDSNVYFKVLEPFSIKKDPDYNAAVIINKKIKNNEIKAYICETTFGMEAISRKYRKDFWNIYKPSIGLNNESSHENNIKLGIQIKPADNEILLDNIHRRFLDAAIAQNVKILRTNLIAFPLSKIPDEAFYKTADSSEFHAANDKMGALYREIEKRGCGVGYIKKICKQQNIKVLHHWAEILDRFEPKLIADAFSEWADALSISCFYGNGFDYFCTNDKGKSAPLNSIFSDDNKEWLKQNFRINILNLQELATVI